MTTLLLVRHGETDWNADGRLQGHTDRPLSDFGRRQARQLAEELAEEKLDAIYASDLSRARETAEIVAARLGADVLPVRDLREIDVGEWEGLTWPEIEARYPEGARSWRERGYGWESGESYEQLGERVVAALTQIAADHPEERVLVVGHGGTIRATRAFIEGLSVPESRARSRAIGNCEVFRVVTEDGTFRGID